jgi:hypothetical protein
MQRFMPQRSECDFPLKCKPPDLCVWAQFHQLDPLTGRAPVPQADLFQSADKTPDLFSTGDSHGEETRKNT